MDFFPTMLELAGLGLKPKLHADGRSLLPELTGKKKGKTSIGTTHTTDRLGNRVLPFAMGIGN